MSERDIIEIASRHEVGGHTVHHLDLTEIPLPAAISEVYDCKQRLESLTSQDVRVFSYPKGRHNDQVIRIVKDAGFLGARTVCWFHIELPRDPYLMPPTINASLHYRMIDIAHLVRRWNPTGLIRYIFVSRLNSNWKTVAIQWFEYVCRHGRVWHLSGHSWEVDQLDLWEDLEQVLRYVARRGGN